jgi:hypothetical protein
MVRPDKETVMDAGLLVDIVVVVGAAFSLGLLGLGASLCLVLQLGSLR